MIVLDLSILNQKGTPMFNSDIFANRPAFGIVGRIFISIDTSAIYRDTGSAWDLIADGTGSASNIYNTNGTLTGNRTVASGGYYLLFNPQTTFNTTLNASVSESIYSVIGVNNLSYTAGFSSNNIGNVYSANGGINLQTFSGSATFAQANLASAMVSVNSLDFTNNSGIVVTMTQSSGIRAMTGHQSQIQFQGSHNGTISHAAISQNLGFYRPASSSKTLTISNAYSLLLNALDDYGAGFTFTNRWGIYQQGASDKNYFAANTLFGTTVDAGFRVDINGTARVSGNATINGSLYLANTSNVVAGAAGDGLYLQGQTRTYFYTGTSTFFARGFNGSLLIGTTAQTNDPNASAVLQADSTTKGFLPPRMITTQKNAIVTPVSGLMVFDTTLNKLCVYSGTAWETITSI